VSGTVTVRKTPFVLVAAAMAWLAVPAARAEITLSIHDGRVVLIANDATIADIIAEWAKVGRIKIVNADKIPRDVVTLELQNVNERQALDIVLRSASGFIVALRAEDDPNASRFDRLVIMPPSTAPPPPQNASAAPQNPRRPAAPVAEPLPEPVQVAADDPRERPDDQPPSMVMESSFQSETIPSFKTNARTMTETVDPRNFRLPPSMSVGAMVLPQGVAAPPVMGSGQPGVITMPGPPTAP